MKSYIKSILAAAAIGLWTSAALAHHIAGTIICADTTPATPLGGITVTLQGTMSTLTGTTMADGSFYISVPTVTDTYTVTIAAPAGMTVTSPASGQYIAPIFANGVGGPDRLDGADFTLTGCVAPPLGKIGDTVYCDANSNGVQDSGEAGIPGVKVTLVCKDAAGAPTATATATTDANGKYLFADIPAGTCEVTVDTTTVPSDCSKPLCATKVTKQLAAGETYLDADFCFTPPPRLGRIGDTVYCDANGNRMQDADESGIPGVKVTLTCKDSTGAVIATVETMTDASGKYLFIDIPAGTCEVTVDPLSVQGDCNVPVCDTKVVVNLGAGEVYMDADFCFTKVQSGPGTGTPGYWKTHPEAWPVDSITIGGRTYTKAQAIRLIGMAEKGDKTLTVFRHLACAKLNVLIGNASACIDGDIEKADDWMAIHPVGSKVKGSSAAWAEISGTATRLDSYNNGLLCAPHRN
jgi:hypothetical protein